MGIENDLTLDFTHLPMQPETYEFHLGQEFFAQFVDEEISNGEVDLVLTVTPLDTDRLKLSFDYEGDVVVECDRCLLPMSVEIDAIETVDVLLGESLNDEDDEEITLDAQEPIYDFSWIVYELLAMNLPIQRMHEIEKCDPEMVKYLISDEPEENAVDTRWEELKREMSRKNNNN